MSNVPNPFNKLTSCGKLHVNSGYMLVPKLGYMLDIKLVLIKSDAIGNMLGSIPESNSLQVGIDICTKCADQHKLAKPDTSTI